MKPGIYADIDNETYHRGPGVSKSQLDLIRRSPLHYRAAVDAANDNEPTEAQAFGAAFHSFLLEPEKFDQTHCLPLVLPEGALVTSDDIKAVLKEEGGKTSGTKPELIERLKLIRPNAIIADELKQRYAIQNAGRTILKPEAWEALRGMRAAVMAHPLAGTLLSARHGVRIEHSVYWIDAATGELCRCRPDFWRADDIVVDIKSTDDASPEEFARTVANYRYHVQAAFYGDGIRAAGHEVRAFVFVAVEKKAPYAVACYALDANTMLVGHNDYRMDLVRFSECRRSGNWPGYGDRIQELSLPAWALRQAGVASQ